jgi:hypothetical protein
MKSGRKFLQRLTPYVDSASGWRNAANAWIAVGISYAGLEVLGLPQESLQSFPEAFREDSTKQNPHDNPAPVAWSYLDAPHYHPDHAA